GRTKAAHWRRSTPRLNPRRCLAKNIRCRRIVDHCKSYDAQRDETSRAFCVDVARRFVPPIPRDRLMPVGSPTKRRRVAAASKPAPKLAGAEGRVWAQSSTRKAHRARAAIDEMSAKC